MFYTFINFILWSQVCVCEYEYLNHHKSENVYNCKYSKIVIV